jgi:hypothetical protein
MAAGAVGGAGGLAALLDSPWPLLVLAGLAVLVVLPLAVVLLTPVLSRDEARCTRALAVLDRLVAVVPGSRVPDSGPMPTPAAPAVAAPASSAGEPVRRWRWFR